MIQYAIDIKGLSEEKLCELFDALQRCDEDVIRENGIAFPHGTEPMVELGYDLANAAWVMAPLGYFCHKTILSPGEFLKKIAEAVTDDDLNRTTNEIELIKQDLAFQITFEEIDWDYFIDTATRAKELQKQYFQKAQHAVSAPAQC